MKSKSIISTNVFFRFFILVCSLSFLVHGSTSMQQYCSPKTVSGIVTSGSFLWCATSGGAFRYNMVTGDKKMYFDHKDFPDPNLVGADKDDAGTIWFGSKSGYLTQLYPKTGLFTNYNACAAAGWYINCVHYFKNSIVVGTNNGLSIFSIEKKSFQNVKQFGNFTSSEVLAIRNFDDTLVILTAEGVAYTTVSNVQTTMFSDPAIWTLVPAKDAFGIIQTQAGIAALQERVAQEIGSDVWLFGGQNSPSSVWKNSVLATDKLGSMATTVAFVKDGIYAIGTQSSFFYLYNEITATLYPIVIDGPTDSYVTNCAIDKGGVLWYVTNDLSGGIGQFNGKNWTTLNDQTSPGLGFLSMGPITALNTITVTSRNDIWLSTFAYGSKFFNRETGVWSSYEDSASLTKTLPSPIARFDAPTNSYWSMISGTCEDSSGYIWLANQKAYNGNIIHIRNPHDPAEWRSISLNDPSYAASFPSEYTGPIAAGYNKKLNTNNIYLGFTSKENLTGGGFVILSYPAGKNPLTATITSSTRLLDNISITGIAVANDSVVWISNDNGIYKLLNNGTLTVAKVNKIISNSGFFAVAIGNNQMPIFAKDRDLYTYIDNSDSLVNITQNGLLAKDIGGITYDSKNGVYWIASKNGIFRYDSGDSTRSIASSSTIDVYPNPMSQKSFKNGHVLHFSGLDIGNPSTIRIFDANGAFVTSISEKNTKLINWNGTNLLGKIITPGVYYYLANAENQSKCRGKIFVTP